MHPHKAAPDDAPGRHTAVQQHSLSGKQTLHMRSRTAGKAAAGASLATAAGTAHHAESQSQLAQPQLSSNTDCWQVLSPENATSTAAAAAAISSQKPPRTGVMLLPKASRPPPSGAIISFSQSLACTRSSSCMCKGKGNGAMRKSCHHSRPLRWHQNHNSLRWSLGTCWIDQAGVGPAGTCVSSHVIGCSMCAAGKIEAEQHQYLIIA